jgi:hypothetical protein
MKTHSHFRRGSGIAARRLAGALLLLVLVRPPARADADDAAGAAPILRRVSVQQGEAVVKLQPDEIKHAGLELTTLTSAIHRPSGPALAFVLDLHPLFDSAASFAAARAEAVRASAAFAASGAGFERARKLHGENHNISTKDLEAAEAASRADEAAALAAAATLRGRRAALEQQWGPRLAGWIADNAPPYQRLVDGGLRLVRVTPVTAGYRTSPPEKISLQRPDGKWIEATLVSAEGEVAPEFQTEGWYFLAEAGGGLLPGRAVDARVPAESVAAVPGAMIPGAAVVWWQGRAWVYVQTAAGVFARREIAADQPEGADGYFVADFPVDHPVVTKGAQVLLSEENKPAGAED